MNPEPPRSGLAALPELDRDILLFVLDHSDTTVEEVAQAVMLSTTATRQHLQRLEYQGLLGHSSQKSRARGRPVHLFNLTAAALDLFPKGHEFTLLGMLAILQRDHPDAYQETFEKLHLQFLQPGLSFEVFRNWSVSERARQLLPWIQRYGHRGSFNLDETGGAFVVSYCPALEVARRHRGMCEAECRWLKGFFPEFAVEIKQTIATGADRCVIRLDNSHANQQDL
ncbi:MAG: helix-turn-helix transcriptional regulator [Dehalococcoidia bacterium]